MKKVSILALLLVVMSSHDLFLKMDSYHLEPGKQSIIKLYNGTFDKSDNVIKRNRMVDVSLVGGGKRIAVDTTQWYEKDSTTLLNFVSGEPGTWVAGVSIRPRNIEMKAADFNHYLEHDGVIDMLDWRKKNNALQNDAVEEYSKHVKTIFQVGDRLSEDYKTVLGYPIEFIPLQNPYDMHPGHVMDVQLLWQGKPLTNQLVYMGVKGHTDAHSHDHDHKHHHGDSTSHGHHHDNSSGLRTDEKGIVSLDLKEKGIYHLRTIHLVNSNKQGLTHESNWATLTFEIGDGHSHHHSHEEAHDHHHDHHHHHGVPTYVYILGSLLLIGGLFFYFNKSK